MSCYVRSREELSSVVPCNGMECYELKAPLFSKQLLCTTKYYSSTTPVLLCTRKYDSSATKYYSNTTLYYKVLVCATKYYSSTTPYCKVVLQYFSVLQSTTPVLQSTTPVLLQYYPVLQSTTLYYKVLLQYYSVLQSTTPVLQSPTPVLLRTAKYSCTTKYYSSTTKYYSVLQSTTPVLLCNVIYNLQCAEHQASASHITKYCACHAKWLSWVIVLTDEMSFAMRGATGISVTPHQILRLPRKMTVMSDRAHRWNVICNARSNRHQRHTSPNTAMRRATGSSLTPHQILRLPRKMTVMSDRAHIWNVIYNARSNRTYTPTSPNTAPAAQNDSHDWSCSHAKHHLHCAEQQDSYSNVTKYCACHAKWMSWLILLTYETSFTMGGATGISLTPHQILRLPRNIALPNLRGICRKRLKCHFQCATDPTMIRPWSEHDPTMKTQTATRRAAELTFRARQEQNLLNIRTFPAPAIIPPFTKCCACHEKWHMNFTKCCTCHKK